ncbi:helix-turn-helix transcriptional regulator [Synechococcus sp. MU1642]|uniref:helix-turn-helix domain-containing protein n=1 Tax=Synechococcus sp. MU1642 TaxID=2508348 RepID=UPI001CF7F7E1|nr:helix-turn-helix transcriptional regulator [Synechococcus sp. MU1642]
MKPRILNLLTNAEQRVVLLLLEGLNNRTIAQRLVISHHTFQCHISRALRKSGCHNRLELVLGLIKDGDPALNRQAAGTMQPMPA